MLAQVLENILGLSIAVCGMILYGHLRDIRVCIFIFIYLFLSTFHGSQQQLVDFNRYPLAGA